MVKKGKKEPIFIGFTSDDDDEEQKSISLEGRKVKEKYNIKLSIGPEQFNQAFNFLKGINRDCVLRFSKDELKIYTLRHSLNFGCIITISGTAMSEYIVDSDVDVFIDFEFLKSTVLSDRFVVYLYVDTAGKRFYLVNGSSKTARTLLSTKNKNFVWDFKNKFFGLCDQIRETYGKVTVGPDLKSAISLIERKKAGGEKITNIVIKGSRIKFVVKDNEEEFDTVVDGIDNESTIEINNFYVLDYLTEFKFNKLLDNTDIYIKQDKHLLMKTSLDRDITVEYMVACRVTTKDEPDEEEPEEEIKQEVSVDQEKTLEEVQHPEEDDDV